MAGRVFEYIALLKKEGPQEWIHEEIRRAAEIAFDFRDEESESNFVETLCVQMGPYHKRDRKDLLTAAVSSFFYCYQCRQCCHCYCLHRHHCNPLISSHLLSNDFILHPDTIISDFLTPQSDYCNILCYDL